MKKYLILLAVITALSFIHIFVNQTPSQVIETYDTIVMYRSGEFKKANVIKFGVYCTASWYKYTTDNVYLKSNGTGCQWSLGI